MRDCGRISMYRWPHASRSHRLCNGHHGKRCIRLWGFSTASAFRAMPETGSPCYAYASSSSSTAAQPPPPNSINIWWAKPSEVPWHSATSMYECLLPAEELAGVYEAADLALRQQRLLARTLERTSLAAALGFATPPQDLTFQRNIHGKPFLSFPASTQRVATSQRPAVLGRHHVSAHDTEGDLQTIKHGPALHHNITHTSGLVGCAISSSCSVGLDVELLSRRPGQLMKLARRRLSSLEYESLSALSSDEDRGALFVRLWTLKEAFVKCRGVGINAAPGLRGFSIGLQSQPALSEDSLSSLCGLPLGNDAPLEITLQLGSSYSNSLTTGRGDSVSATNSSSSGSSSSSGDGTGLGAAASQAGACRQEPGGDHHGINAAEHRPSLWKFLLFQPSEQHIAALCVEGAPCWLPCPQLQSTGRPAGLDSCAHEGISMTHDSSKQAADAWRGADASASSSGGVVLGAQRLPADALPLQHAGLAGMMHGATSLASLEAEHGIATQVDGSERCSMQHGMKVFMRQCVPLYWERPLLDCTGTASPIVLGCSL